MKVLLLLDAGSEDIYSEFYAGFHKQIGSVDYRRLDKTEQENLKLYFQNHVELEKYDRIVLHLDFLKMVPQVRFFRQLANIVFFDTSACFDDMSDSPHYQQHLRFYKKIPWARVIVSSYQIMDKLQIAGVDAWCVPKGYQSLKYTDKGESRDITLALIEDELTELSSERSNLIESLRQKYPRMVIFSDAADTLNRLHRIRIAVFPDVGAGEYRSKVFTAMASGCMVMCYEQGRDEAPHMGLINMENIVLFKDFEDFCDKLKYLSENSGLVGKIAKEGYEFAIAHHQQTVLGRQAAQYIGASVREMSDYRLGISVFGFHF